MYYRRGLILQGFKKNAVLKCIIENKMSKFKIGDRVLFMQELDNPCKKEPLKISYEVVEKIGLGQERFYYLSNGICATKDNVFTKKEAKQKFNEWLEK